MKVFGMTDRGKVRRENQDSFRIDYPDGKTLLLVCDGMGGVNGGAVASDTACEAFLFNLHLALSKADIPEDAVLLSEAASYANISVYDRARTDKDCEGMGTTLVAALVTGDECSIVNVGDSRAYLLRDGECSQITRDHSLVEEMVQRGLISRDEARHHPRKNVITRAVGLGYRMKSDSFALTLREGDRILLCSDGLSNVAEDGEIAQIVFSTEDAETACGLLLQKALERGAPDNVTAALLIF